MEPLDPSGWNPGSERPPVVEVLPPRGAPSPPPPVARPRYGLALLLLGLTFVTTTAMGAAWQAAGSDSDPLSWLGWKGLVLPWTDAAALRAGLSFSLPVMFILLCHELGHYIACRRYGIAATLPYFLPAPLGLGTFGAFIKIRSPIRGKRELFDIGIAGPLAGFVALLPFLVLGVLRAQVASPQDLPPDATQSVLGINVLTLLVLKLLRPEVSLSTPLEVGPFWLAAWVGMLATSLNLLPLAQLDGGHILYAVTGRLQRRLAWPLWAVLLALSLLWPGWILWTLIVLVMGLRHPPVWDEATPLSRNRRLLAVVALLILVLCFMPVPIAVLEPQ